MEYWRRRDPLRLVRLICALFFGPGLWESGGVGNQPAAQIAEPRLLVGEQVGLAGQGCRSPSPALWGNH